MNNKIIGGIMVSLFIIFLSYRMLYVTHALEKRGQLTVGVITQVITGGSGSMIVKAKYCVGQKLYHTTRSLKYEFLYESVGKKYLVVYDRENPKTSHLYYELSLDDSVSTCRNLESMIDIDKLDLSFSSIHWNTDIVDLSSVAP